MDSIHGVLPLLLGGAVLQALAGYLHRRSAQGRRRSRGAETRFCISHGCLEACETPAQKVGFDQEAMSLFTFM